ncbi:ABC transporter ATP-binding protein [Schaalia hyovaginalis]|uniref:ABC transporter ATP-binding protein n=1 Tax=Schaalia hyovaginalis TaxID=29316 RepID=UPI001F1B3569|nr:ABC transporter ATP-binding protein [Schaalia hyovaginalis]MCF2711675.1 ABC transporter ATP-binding protein [Schaalia hyovaginalis]
MNEQGIPVLAAEQATQRYPLPRTNPFRRAEILTAVEATDFRVHAGESVGIVGESGSGKTTLCRMLVGQEKPAGGRILHRGRDVWARGFDTLSYRRSVQMVFQNPKSSFDPRMTVGEALREPMRSLRVEGDVESRIRTVLDQVGLESRVVERFPHEFSGGQLQRLAIARALIPGPEVLVADEPVSALDVSIQAQVLNLLKDLVRDLGLALVMIAHDLSVVGCTTERVYVMSNARVVEKGEPSHLFFSPSAPETKELVDAVLDVGDGLAGKGLD